MGCMISPKEWPCSGSDDSGQVVGNTETIYKRGFWEIIPFRWMFKNPLKLLPSN